MTMRKLAGDLQNTILDDYNGLTLATVWPSGSPGGPDRLGTLQGTTWACRIARHMLVSRL